MEKHHETPKSFEETYPQYPFSELVRLSMEFTRLSIALGKWLKRSHEALVRKGQMIEPRTKPHSPDPRVEQIDSPPCAPEPLI